MDCGAFPTTEQGLRALREKPASLEANWNGPYLETDPADAWGNPFQYRCPAEDGQHDFDLWSSGADGKTGTGDDIIFQKKTP